MNYQEAKLIRNVGLSRLIMENLANKDSTVIGSIKTSMKQKMTAKGKGMSEKFDMMNILKLMGFGTKVGSLMAAGYGKARGRSQEDIDYFTGRNNYGYGYGGRFGMGSRTQRRTAGGRDDPFTTKVTPRDVKRVRSNDSISDILAKMYNFMWKTHEDDKKFKELQQGFLEEEKAEDQRRHEELLRAVKNFSPKVPEEEKVPEEKLPSGSLIGKMISSIVGVVSGLLNGIFGIVKGIGSVFVSIGSAIFDTLKFIGDGLLAMTKVIKLIPMLFGLIKGIFGSLASLLPKILKETLKAVFLKMIPGLAGLMLKLLSPQIKIIAGTTAAMIYSSFIKPVNEAKEAEKAFRQGNLPDIFKHLRKIGSGTEEVPAPGTSGLFSVKIPAVTMTKDEEDYKILKDADDELSRVEDQIRKNLIERYGRIIAENPQSRELFSQMWQQEFAEKTGKILEAKKLIAQMKALKATNVTEIQENKKNNEKLKKDIEEYEKIIKTKNTEAIQKASKKMQTEYGQTDIAKLKELMKPEKTKTLEELLKETSGISVVPEPTAEELIKNYLIDPFSGTNVDTELSTIVSKIPEFEQIRSQISSGEDQVKSLISDTATKIEQIESKIPDLQKKAQDSLNDFRRQMEALKTSIQNSIETFKQDTQKFISDADIEPRNKNTALGTASGAGAVSP